MKSLILKFCVLALFLTFPFTTYAAETDQSLQRGQMMYGDMSRPSMGLMHQYMGSHPYSDRMFLSVMTSHHEGAIAMAQEVLKNGKDPQVKKWAEEVLSAQASEIKDMQGWLMPMGGHDPEHANWMNGAMRHMMASPMHADPDRNFVEMMIKHHVGALEMAIFSLEQSTDQNVLKLSKDIFGAQAEEIYKYKQWLLKE